MGEWEKANNSPLNLMDGVTADLHLPSSVYFHDTTLRDGEQFPGVEFTKEDKLQIAKALDDYGVQRIEIMPAVSPEDLETAAELNAMGLSADIVGFCRSVQADVEKAVEAGCERIVMEIVAYPALLEGLGWSFEEATDKFITTCRFANEKGLKVTAFFVAVTDSPLDFTEKFIKKILAEAEIDSMGIPDTFSKLLPQAVYHFVRLLKSWTDKPVEVHTHNAFNMGVANAVAGVTAGAEGVHGCINSLGEGAGNASLEAVAFNLQMMLGMETGIRFEKTQELCTLVSELARVPLQANWPLTGERVFTTESGIVVDLVTKMNQAGAGLPPEHDIAGILGRQRGLVVGKMSGGTSIKVKMKQLGLPAVDDAEVGEILAEVKTKSIAKHDSLTDDEFVDIVTARGGKQPTA